MSGTTANQRPAASKVLGGLLAAAVVLSLGGGIAGGLLRAGTGWPPADWGGAAVVGHGFLMICAFMATVIGIERAVALKQAWAFAAPAASGTAGLSMLSGWPAAAAALAVLAGLAFVAVNGLLVSRQRAPHTVLLLVAALAWLAGNALFAGGAGAQVVLPWWFGFLVMTIAAERLEMTRLMRRRPGASALLHSILAAMLAGCALSALSPAWGGLLFGASLTGLALWLGCFDVARRTMRAAGLSRYMAVCLLLGYVWLAIAGLAWMATAAGLPLRDAALHALGLGFVFSMMLGHAPVILPALARVKLHFGWAFYLPLLLLHGSLIVRLFGQPQLQARTAGAAGNAAAILLFAATIAGAAIAWRVQHPRASQPDRPERHEHHAVVED